MTRVLLPTLCCAVLAASATVFGPGFGPGFGPVSAWGAPAPVSPASGVHHPVNDYPTSARADYVIGCLAGVGFKREELQRCSCVIDAIADLMPYSDYDEAATILSMQQGGLGQRGALFRDTPIAKVRIEELHRAQAEASLRCQ